MSDEIPKIMPYSTLGSDGLRVVKKEKGQSLPGKERKAHSGLRKQHVQSSRDRRQFDILYIVLLAGEGTAD